MLSAALPCADATSPSTPGPSRGLRRMRRGPPSVWLIALLLASILSCSLPAHADQPLLLTGAGSTFDAPFFAHAFSLYQQHSSVRLSYQACGSGAGILAFSSNSVDFGATDVPMNSVEQMLAGGDVVQIPVILGAVALAYNEPKILGSQPLRLDGSTLAAIYLNRITTWNDPAIASLNPGLRLPPDRIHPIHRSDSSGTTYIFTDYLSTVSPAWASTVGRGKSVAWQGGFSGKGSPGLAAWLRRHAGSLGYVELKYAVDEHLPVAAVRNRDGTFNLPTSQTVTAAASQFSHLSPRSFSIVNAPGSRSYPISGYSWALLRARPADRQRAETLNTFFRWLVTDGQASAAPLNYAPMPLNARQTALAGLASLMGVPA